MPKFKVTWGAHLTLVSEVEAPTREAAEKLAMDNSVSLNDADRKECEPTSADARLMECTMCDEAHGSDESCFTPDECSHEHWTATGDGEFQFDDQEVYKTGKCDQCHANIKETGFVTDGWNIELIEN